MDNQQAIEILNTDINEKLIRRWFLLQSPFFVLIALIIVEDLLAPGLQLRISSLLAPTFSGKDVLSLFFIGTITACSVLIGLFLLMAYNFRREFDSNYRTFGEALNEIRDKRRVLREQRGEELTEEEKAKAENLRLNRCALAHQMEHEVKFTVTYFGVCIFYLLVNFGLLITLVTSSIFNFFLFCFCVLFIMATSFGIVLLINEFTHFPEHTHL